MRKDQFKSLYEYCQTLEPKVSRTKILKHTLEVTSKSVKDIKTTMDTSISRGFFYSSANTNQRIVQQLGCNVIVLARGQKYCWDRFIYTKELMHLFDDSNESTNSAEKFEKLLVELEAAPPTGGTMSDQSLSEFNGFWMALACLCPENNRLEFENQRNKKHIDDYGIALLLKIPELYVPLLFIPQYRNFIDTLLK